MQKEQITGIYAGNHEFCLDMTRELTRRLELPFYASEEGWACARDKARFKEHCMAVGLDVPQRYFVKKPYTQEMFAKISYPVIVKPVDACAQRGLTLCGSEEELITAYEKALQYSQKKEVIVEEFIEGEEVSMEYFFLDGHPVFCRINDLLPVSVNNRPIFVLSGSRAGTKKNICGIPPTKQMHYFNECSAIQELLSCRRFIVTGSITFWNLDTG